MTDKTSSLYIRLNRRLHILDNDRNIQVSFTYKESFDEISHSTRLNNTINNLQNNLTITFDYQHRLLTICKPKKERFAQICEKVIN